MTDLQLHVNKLTSRSDWMKTLQNSKIGLINVNLCSYITVIFSLCSFMPIMKIFN